MLRIISTKLFVLWQVLKPPTRKAISKRILSQRFYFFNLTLWLNYKKTGRQMYNEKTQNWNIARSFCAKVLLRIISNKLFVLWQVLKPPIRKAIFKRILRQRFYFFNPTQWLNYMKTGYPIFIDRCLKPVQIGLFQMPALFFYKNNFA